MNQRERIEEIEEQLQNMVAALQNKGRDPDEWLRHLHSGFQQRMISDGANMWKIGAVLVPLSLAAFPAYAAVPRHGLEQALLFGLFSSLMIWTWILAGDYHRSFQQASEAWLIAIKGLIGLEKESERDVVARDRDLNSLLRPPETLRKGRYFLGAATLILWLLIALLALF